MSKWKGKVRPVPRGTKVLESPMDFGDVQDIDAKEARPSAGMDTQKTNRLWTNMVRLEPDV